MAGEQLPTISQRRAAGVLLGWPWRASFAALPQAPAAGWLLPRSPQSVLRRCICDRNGLLGWCGSGGASRWLALQVAEGGGWGRLLLFKCGAGSPGRGPGQGRARGSRRSPAAPARGRRAPRESSSLSIFATDDITIAVRRQRRASLGSPPPLPAPQPRAPLDPRRPLPARRRPRCRLLVRHWASPGRRGRARERLRCRQRGGGARTLPCRAAPSFCARQGEGRTGRESDTGKEGRARRWVVASRGWCRARSAGAGGGEDLPGALQRKEGASVLRVADKRGGAVF